MWWKIAPDYLGIRVYVLCTALPSYVRVEYHIHVMKNSPRLPEARYNWVWYWVSYWLSRVFLWAFECWVSSTSEISYHTRIVTPLYIIYTNIHFLTVQDSYSQLRKWAIRKAGWDLRYNKKLESVGRTHCQIRNPACSFPVSCYK